MQSSEAKACILNYCCSFPNRAEASSNIPDPRGPVTTSSNSKLCTWSQTVLIWSLIQFRTRCKLFCFSKYPEVVVLAVRNIRAGVTRCSWCALLCQADMTRAATKGVQLAACLQKGQGGAKHLLGFHTEYVYRTCLTGK